MGRFLALVLMCVACTMQGVETGNMWAEGGFVDASLIFAGAVTAGPCGFAIPGSSITQLFGEEDCTVNGGTGREFLGSVAECTEYCINQCSNCAGFAYNSATTLCFMNHDMTGNPSSFSQSPPSASTEFYLMNEASACIQAKSGEARCVAADGVGTGSGATAGLVVSATNRSSCLGITGLVFAPAQCVKADCGPNGGRYDHLLSFTLSCFIRCLSFCSLARSPSCAVNRTDLTPECTPELCEIVSGVASDACSQTKCEERGMLVSEICPVSEYAHRKM